jgi:hypothetical protein
MEEYLRMDKITHKKVQLGNLCCLLKSAMRRWKSRSFIEFHQHAEDEFKKIEAFFLKVRPI